ncbi:MAG: sialate O-acetylesterase, partial [Planctomycetota bacterium]
ASRYTHAEWRHVLQFLSCRNVKVLGLTLTESGGDGIYLGAGKSGVPNKDVLIKDVTCHRNYRQGISVITAENLLIENTTLSDTAGTAPQAGIDFEPNHPDQRIVNCVLRNCVARNNAGGGFVSYLANLDAKSAPVSLRIENCTSIGNRGDAVAFITLNAPDAAVTGTFELIGCELRDSLHTGIAVGNNPVSGCRIQIKNCSVINTATANPLDAPIVFTAGGSSTQDLGGATFENVTINDAMKRHPTFRRERNNTMISGRRFRCGYVVGLLSCIAAGTLAECADSTGLKLTQPQPYQVIQRIGTAPGAGFAEVAVHGDIAADAKQLQNATWEYRVVPTADDAARRRSEWTGLNATVNGAAFEAVARIAAGGWYRLEIRLAKGDDSGAASSVEPIGVGEVFLVAGQSYATNCNDQQLKVTDPSQRVVAFDAATETWRVANDPQPVPDGSDGGSIWPPLGDALAKELRVPIGFANVAVGATSSMQWIPEGALHSRLVKVGKTLGQFRAVLWQQGESDVIAKTSAEQYVANLVTIRESAAKGWRCDPSWLLAKSTHHPTVYNDPEGEGRIRGAIAQLLKQPGFKAGPDTDTLKGENRGDAKSRRHFSAIGQERAAEMWLAAIRREVIPDVEQASDLPESERHAGNAPREADSLLVGVAETDITPPVRDARRQRADLDELRESRGRPIGRTD